jgi:site-specific DNA recombinase
MSKGKTNKKELSRKPEGPVRVALYSRISTDEANQPYSLGAQDDRLRSYVKSQENWKVWRTYEDQMTGTVLDRPGLQAALADAQQGLFDLLLVFRVDRLARSVRTLAAIIEDLDACGASFRSATEPFDTSMPAGRMMLQMLGVFAEFERATLIERITAGLERKASGGFWNGKAPFGYVYGSQTGCLKEKPDEAAIVNKIFELYVSERNGCASIARWLNDNGYRNRLGNLWRQQAVRDIVANRAYLGEIPWKGESYVGKHEAIVDREVFANAQGLLEQRGEEAGRRRSNTTDFLLTGLLRCERCKHSFSGTTARGNGGTYRYYTCQKRVDYGTAGCDQERLPADDIERDVLMHVLINLRDDEILKEAWDLHQQSDESRKPNEESELRQLEQDEQKVRGQIDRYLSAFEEGKLPPEACAPRLQELHSRQLKIQSRTESLRARLEGGDSKISSFEDAQSLAVELAKLLENYKGEDIPKLKELLRKVIRKVLVNSRSEIRPFLMLPLVRVMTGSVGATGFEPVTPAL